VASGIIWNKKKMKKWLHDIYPLFMNIQGVTERPPQKTKGVSQGLSQAIIEKRHPKVGQSGRASGIGEIENFITRLCELQENLFWLSWSLFCCRHMLVFYGEAVLGQAV
jgi:hypothetical protein